MTLLEDVIAGACGTAPVADLLRQVKVLSRRSGAPRLDEWVTHELGGYRPDDEVPAYRGPFDALALGHFMGPMRMELTNVQIPPITFPQEWRSGPLFRFEFREPVAELDQWLRNDVISYAWPPDAVLWYNSAVSKGKVRRIVRDGMVLAEARVPIDKGRVTAVLDAVRTKILDLVLDLEQVAPTAGEANATDEVRARAADVINHFYGDIYGEQLAVGNTGPVVQVPPDLLDAEAEG